MNVINISKNTVLGDRVALADSFISRLFGLVLRHSLPEGEGLIIKPCNSIHMFFMKFSIDLLFVDKDDTIVYLVEEMKPWKISKVILNSYYVIELPSGVIAKTRTEIGDKLEIT